MKSIHNRQTFELDSVRKLFKPGLVAVLMALGLSSTAWAEEASEEDAADAQTSETGSQAADASSEDRVIEEVIVTGTFRDALSSSIALKRSSSTLVDGLVGEDMGALPDLSVAETLEQIVSVSSDRFKGGASEISIRGMGAFLSSSVLNGREITSGSDGRGVNFYQFPSELVRGVLVSKTQQADFIEGGISGVIMLQTLKPLDYGKQRFQADVRAQYNEYEARLDDGDEWGGRGTLSYVNQWETGIGDIGVSIGGQIVRSTAPEEMYTSSSSWRPCNSAEGIDQSNNCAYREGAGATDTYFVSNQYLFRQMETVADRESVMADVQWQPNENWDVALDMQYSFRHDIEDRNNMVIADGRRDIFPLDIAPSGALNAWTGETRMENQTAWRQRDEEYYGGGLAVNWSNDRYSMLFDLGYNKTVREQDEKDMRIRTGPRVNFMADTIGLTVPEITFLDSSSFPNGIDLNDHDIYDNGARARRRLEDVEDDIMSVRLEGAMETDTVFSTIRAGLRYSERQRIHDDGQDTTLSLVGGYDSAGAIAARRPFPQDDFLSGANGNNIGGSWATWDSLPLWEALTGSQDAGLPVGNTRSIHDTDVTEEVMSLFLMADFSTEIGGRILNGNMGVRYVDTDVSSVGVSQALSAVPNEDGTLDIVAVGEPFDATDKNSFSNWLPSLNAVYDLNDDWLVRGALYSAISRPSMEAMSAAVQVSSDAFETVGEAITAAGNPYLEPLESNNADLSFEWYPNDNSLLAIAVYYKDLKTGIETVTTDRTFIVNGQDEIITVSASGNSSESSSLYGIEISGQHAFDYLPSPWDGFGVLGGFNYTDSDFEFPDPSIRDGQNALEDFTEPANLPGYSERSANATVYWEKNRWNVRLAYKYRSTYFKPFRQDPNRFVGSQDFLDMSVFYNLNEHFQFRFQALNLTDEPNVMYRPTRDSLAQADYSGRKYFIGVRFRY